MYALLIVCLCVLKILYMCSRGAKNTCWYFLWAKYAWGFLSCSSFSPSRHCAAMCLHHGLLVMFVDKRVLMLHGQIPAIVVQSYWLYPHTHTHTHTHTQFLIPVSCTDPRFILSNHPDLTLCLSLNVHIRLLQLFAELVHLLPNRLHFGF